jgi:HTH-type transcriptional regulator/antitoxin HigA
MDQLSVPRRVRAPEGERLDVLATLVEAYERKHFPMDLPDPIEAIKFRMEQSALAPKDLVPMIGQLNRVYEVLSRKRPSESLIKPDERRKAA